MQTKHVGHVAMIFVNILANILQNADCQVAILLMCRAENSSERWMATWLNLPFFIWENHGKAVVFHRENIFFHRENLVHGVC